MDKLKEIELRLDEFAKVERFERFGPDKPNLLPALVLELCREVIRLRSRVQALEVIAGVERLPKEKVRAAGHDYAQDRE